MMRCEFAQVITRPRNLEPGIARFALQRNRALGRTFYQLVTDAGGSMILAAPAKLQLSARTQPGDLPKCG